jgi:hypothetical protein
MDLPLSDPLSYPFGIPGRCFALSGGEIHHSPLTRWPSGTATYEAVLLHFGDVAAPMPIEHPVGLLTCGSNASPRRLAQKLARSPNPTAYGMRLAVTGWVPVYASTLSDYGAIPATFEWMEGVAAEPFLLLIDAASLATIEATELRGGNYDRYEVPPSSVDLQTDYPLYAFVGRHGALRIAGECFALPEFAPPAAVPGLSQEALIGRVLAELESPLGVEDYRSSIRDREFVVKMRTCIRQRFASPPNVPGWVRLGNNDG